MRVLLASDFYPPSPGGLEGHVQRLGGALIDRGHQVTMVTCTAEPEPLAGATAIAGAPTVLGRVPALFGDGSRPYPPPFPDMAFRRTVRALTRTWRPDVIHAHGWCAFSCYWPGSPPLVVTLHDHGMRCPKRTLVRSGRECASGRGARCVTCAGDQPAGKRLPLAAAMGYSVPRLAARTGRFIAVSRMVARRFAELCLDTQVDVIPNFLDLPDVAPGAPDEPPTALYVGPDSPHKGRPVLISAFRQLAGTQARLSLVGSGDVVSEPGIRAHGYLRGRDLWEQYERASVVAVPSVWPDPCPTVVLEAMAHGRPVVGSRVGGIPDLVEDGVTGLLVPPSDPAALARALARLLADRALRDRLGLAARARARRFSSAMVVPRIEEVYVSARREAGGAPPEGT